MKLGQFPLIFVAHSLGGIVVKKAVILAHHDVQHIEITRAIHAILFLSTPHRGSQYAELLNQILTVSAGRYAPKQFINELKANSPALQDINDQFRNRAVDIHLSSFYETSDTSVGPTTIRLLTQDTSTLGWPRENIIPIPGDHHDVCKFLSPKDPGYLIIRQSLQNLVGPFVTPKVSSAEELLRLKSLLGVTHNPEDDFQYLFSRRMDGSCEWALMEPVIERFMSDANPAHPVSCGVLADLAAESQCTRSPAKSRGHAACILPFPPRRSGKGLPKHIPDIIGSANCSVSACFLSTTYQWQKRYSRGLLVREEPLPWTNCLLQFSPSIRTSST